MWDQVGNVVKLLEAVYLYPLCKAEVNKSKAERGVRASCREMSAMFHISNRNTIG